MGDDTVPGGDPRGEGDRSPKALQYLERASPAHQPWDISSSSDTEGLGAGWGLGKAGHRGPTCPMSPAPQPEGAWSFLEAEDQLLLCREIAGLWRLCCDQVLAQRTLGITGLMGDLKKLRILLQLCTKSPPVTQFPQRVTAHLAGSSWPPHCSPVLLQ